MIRILKLNKTVRKLFEQQEIDRKQIVSLRKRLHQMSEMFSKEVKAVNKLNKDLQKKDSLTETMKGNMERMEDNISKLVREKIKLEKELLTPKIRIQEVLVLRNENSELSRELVTANDTINYLKAQLKL
jgi:chromosome segregation ATPase